MKTNPVYKGRQISMEVTLRNSVHWCYKVNVTRWYNYCKGELLQYGWAVAEILKLGLGSKHSKTNLALWKVIDWQPWRLKLSVWDPRRRKVVAMLFAMMWYMSLQPGTAGINWRPNVPWYFLVLIFLKWWHTAFYILQPFLCMSSSIFWTLNGYIWESKCM